MKLNKIKTFESYLNEDAVSKKFNVSDKLYECYEHAVTEATEWNGDVHDDHTVESYMKENAALVAALAVKVLKECNEEYTTEQFETAVHSLKDAYSKKINEMVEMEGAEVVESESVKMYSQEEINEAFVNAGTSQEGISAFMSSLTKSI